MGLIDSLKAWNKVRRESELMRRIRNELLFLPDHIRSLQAEYGDLDIPFTRIYIHIPCPSGSLAGAREELRSREHHFRFMLDMTYEVAFTEARYNRGELIEPASIELQALIVDWIDLINVAKIACVLMFGAREPADLIDFNRGFNQTVAA